MKGIILKTQGQILMQNVNKNKKNFKQPRHPHAN